MLNLIWLLVVLLVIGSFFSYPRGGAGWGGYGYAPFGGMIGVIVLLIIIWFVLGGVGHGSW